MYTTTSLQFYVVTAFLTQLKHSIVYILHLRTFNGLLCFQINLSHGDTDDTDEDDGEPQRRRRSRSPSTHINGNRHLVDRFFNDKVQVKNYPVPGT